MRREPDKFKILRTIYQLQDLISAITAMVEHSEKKKNVTDINLAHLQRLTVAINRKIFKAMNNERRDWKRFRSVDIDSDQHRALYELYAFNKSCLDERIDLFYSFMFRSIFVELDRQKLEYQAWMQKRSAQNKPDAVKYQLEQFQKLA